VTGQKDRKTGRYTDTKLDKVCRVCGHRLGQHAAEKDGDEQPCLVPDCVCVCFQRSIRGQA
jgi:hypothetical protein